MSIIDRLNQANRLAPQPSSRDAGRDEWVRHYAASALAADAAFRAGPGTDGPGENLGLIAEISHAYMSAAAALDRPDDMPGLLWDLTPELGALNGEWVDWLAATVDRHGINPADLYEWFEADDFHSPRVQVADHG